MNKEHTEVSNDYRRSQEQQRKISHGPAEKSAYEKKQDQHKQIPHGPGRKTGDQGRY